MLECCLLPKGGECTQRRVKAPNSLSEDWQNIKYIICLSDGGKVSPGGFLFVPSPTSHPSYPTPSIWTIEGEMEGGREVGGRKGEREGGGEREREREREKESRGTQRLGLKVGRPGNRDEIRRALFIEGTCVTAVGGPEAWSRQSRIII